MRHLTVTAMVLALLLVPGGTLAADHKDRTVGVFEAAGSLAEARTGHTATLLQKPGPIPGRRPRTPEWALPHAKNARVDAIADPGQRGSC